MLNLTRSGVRAMRMVLAAALILCVLAPLSWTSGASAQDETGLIDDNEYVLLAGGTLTWDAPWEIVEDQSGFDEVNLGDSILLVDDDASRISFFTLPAVSSADEIIDLIVGNYAASALDTDLLELSSDKHAGHALIRTNGDEEFATYIDIASTKDLSTLLVTSLDAPLDDFASVLEGVHDSIELDGDPLLNGADPASIQDLLENGEALVPPDTANQPDDDEGDDSSDENTDKKLPDEDADATSTPDDDDQADATSTPDDADEEDEDGDATSTPDDSEFADLGLIDDTSYQSPQYDTEVTWSEAWTADTTFLVSDEDEAVDRVTLVSEDFDTSVFMSFFDAADVNPEDWVEGMLGGLDEKKSTVTILDQDSRDGIETLYYRFESFGDVQFGIIEVRELEGSDVTMVVELLGVEDDVRDAFESAQDDIEIDGGQLFEDFRRFPRITPDDRG